jgi:UDP-glucose 4-epimerase
MPGMKVVVTGATGNVGTALLRRLGTDPAVDEVVGVARRLPEDGEYAGTRIVAADVARDRLDPAFTGADAVVHLAWALQPSRNLDALARTNVEGTRRVLAAAARNGLSTVVVASSVGVYSPGPKDRRVDESWPRRGVRSSEYARFKVQVEDLLDAFERAHPQVRVVRLRPGLIFQATSASAQRRLFAGPFVPGSLARPGLLPLLPRLEGLVTQAVHADDVAEAYRLALVNDAARGPFNVATEPVIDLELLQRVLEVSRTVSVPRALARAGYSAAFRLRLLPTRPGWLDLALGTPLLDTTRAHEVLGWTPRYDAEATLRDLLQGMVDDRGDRTPVLRTDAGGPGRIDEVRSGVGARDGAELQDDGR